MTTIDLQSRFSKSNFQSQCGEFLICETTKLFSVNINRCMVKQYMYVN